MALSITVILVGLIPGSAVAASPFEGPVPQADCGPGSMPELGLQGSVSVEDRRSGRSADGYSCNLQTVGRFPGDGAEWQMATYGDCAYYGQKYALLGGFASQPGTVILDVQDPANPQRVGTLTTPAMLSPWESLKVNRKRGLLAAVYAPLQGAAYFDIYDVKEDCRHPRLLASVPINGLGHEGEFAPDGRTYYATGLAPELVTAIDTSTSTAPKRLTSFVGDPVVHGMGISADGRRMYLATVPEDFVITAFAGPPLTDHNGMIVYDVSAIQDRRGTDVRKVSEINWRDGSIGQHGVPFTKDDTPYVLFVDELARGGARFIDISDETRPRIVSKLKLEIHMPEHAQQAIEEELSIETPHGVPAVPRGLLPLGYNFHYCTLDRRIDPTLAICATIESGIRVFDIRSLRAPKEIAYYNPGGDGRLAPASWAGTTSGFTTALPRLDKRRRQIWFTDQDAGFFVVKMTNNVWPFSSRHRCRRRSALVIRRPGGRMGRHVTLRASGQRVRARRVGPRRMRVSTKQFGNRRSITIRARAIRPGGKRVGYKRSYKLCRP